MSYYRVALAAACAGNLTASLRFVRISLLLGEDSPNAERLLELLVSKTEIPKYALEALRAVLQSRKYYKGLRIRLPKTSKAHTIRGLLFAQIERFGAARKEFTRALAIDTGNEIARKALLG